MIAVAVEERRVVLDTDFIGGITSYEAGDGAGLFCRVFRTLDKCPVIHPYVAEYELSSNAIAQSLISSGELIVIPYADFLPSDGFKQILYRKTFQDLHTIIREAHIPRRGCPEMLPLGLKDDIFGRQAGRSFGEIHSILMAVELGIPLFYSNDTGTKTAVNRYHTGRLIVQNAEEVSELLKEADQSQVTGAERRFIRHFYTRNRH